MGSIALTNGWLYDIESNKLCRPKDRTTIQASADKLDWGKQIVDFEFREGAQWTPEQIAAMKPDRPFPAPIEIPPVYLSKWWDLFNEIGSGEPMTEERKAAIRALRSQSGERVLEAMGAIQEPVHVAGTITERCGDLREWSDERFRAPPIVTPEMVKAGEEARELSKLGAFAGHVTEEEVIYRAMHALAPVELVSEGERRAVRERDEALAREIALMRDLDEEREYIRKFNNYAMSLERETFDLGDKLVARDATIADLNTKLAHFTSATVAQADRDAFKTLLDKPEHEGLVYKERRYKEQIETLVTERDAAAPHRVETTKHTWETGDGQLWRRMEDSVELGVHNWMMKSAIEERERLLVARDATIADLNTRLACRPPAVMHVPAPVGAEVRPAMANDAQPLHWVQHSDGQIACWTWKPHEKPGGRWLWVDTCSGEVNAYSGMDGFRTGPQDAYAEGWRYLGVAQFTAANVPPADAKPAHNPFKHRERDPRRMGPEGFL